MSRFNRTQSKTALARQLRRNETDVERLLWRRLRNGQIDNAQFRRQHPAGRYVLDFYCPALALVIELDGGQHAQTATRDQKRDAWLQGKGVTILRFWNSDVTENLTGVLEVIAAKVGDLRALQTPSHAHWHAALPTDPHPAAFGRRPPPFRGR